MGKTRGIEWCDSSWNPWQGCHKVSPGCAHCYMFRDKIRYGQEPNTVVRSKPATFTAPLTWKDPLKIFTCSWSDFFIEEADAWRDDAWDIIRRTPRHTYQILTKRPENIANRIPIDWPLPNVWLGVSLENNKFYDRIRRLRYVRASVKFLSVEPLLGSVADIPLDGIDWVIVGGESGPKARPMKIQWAREVRDKCVAAGIPFFFKQWSNSLRCDIGRRLDGREWSEFPR